MPAKAMGQRRIDILKRVFTSPFYLILTAIVAIAYYAIFYYFILISNNGFFFLTAPLPLVYSLILSAAILLSLSIYAIGKSVRAKYAGAEGGVLSILTSSLGSLIVGCSCYAPVLASIMYAIGFGTLAVGSAISLLSIYQSWFVVVLVAINLIFIYYQLGRIIRIGGPAAR